MNLPFVVGKLVSDQAHPPVQGGLPESNQGGQVRHVEGDLPTARSSASTSSPYRGRCYGGSSSITTRGHISRFDSPP
jgi:hypothetical protein